MHVDVRMADGRSGVWQPAESEDEVDALETIVSQLEMELPTEPAPSITHGVEGIDRMSRARDPHDTQCSAANLDGRDPHGKLGPSTSLRGLSLDLGTSTSAAAAAREFSSDSAPRLDGRRGRRLQVHTTPSHPHLPSLGWPTWCLV
jgi:hypothetical protein